MRPKFHIKVNRVNLKEYDFIYLVLYQNFKMIK